MTLETFLKRYHQLYDQQAKIRGTGLFFVRDIHRIPPYMVETLFVNNIIYEDNIIVSVIRVKEPFGVSGRFREPLAKGLRSFEIKAGYMEVVGVEKILRKFGIEEKAIFYGSEDIFTGNFIWKIFALIKKLSPSRMQFYKLPYPKLHGVLTRVDL
jgi:KUP system potassium uptake protein